MKIILGSFVTAAVLAVFLFSFSQAYANCGPDENYTDACAAAAGDDSNSNNDDSNNNDRPCPDGQIQIGGNECVKDTADAGWEDENNDGIADGQEYKKHPCGDDEICTVT